MNSELKDGVGDWGSDGMVIGETLLLCGHNTGRPRGVVAYMAWQCHLVLWYAGDCARRSLGIGWTLSRDVFR